MIWHINVCWKADEMASLI